MLACDKLDHDEEVLKFSNCQPENPKLYLGRVCHQRYGLVKKHVASSLLNERLNTK